MAKMDSFEFKHYVWMPVCALLSVIRENTIKTSTSFIGRYNAYSDILSEPTMSTTGKKVKYNVLRYAFFKEYSEKIAQTVLIAHSWLSDTRVIKACLYCDKSMYDNISLLPLRPTDLDKKITYITNSKSLFYDYMCMVIECADSGNFPGYIMYLNPRYKNLRLFDISNKDETDVATELSYMTGRNVLTAFAGKPVKYNDNIEHVNNNSKLTFFKFIKSANEENLFTSDIPY